MALSRGSVMGLADDPGSEMRVFTWRHLLPTVQVLVAISLLYAAHVEEEVLERMYPFTSRADYVPLPNLFSALLSLPAYIVAFLIVDPLGIKYPASELIFLTTVALFWYWVGRQLDASTREWQIAWLVGLTIAWIMAVLSTTLVMGESAHGQDDSWMLILWVFIIVAYCLQLLDRLRLRRRNLPPTKAG
jgi:hypothetical protein